MKDSLILLFFVGVFVLASAFFVFESGENHFSGGRITGFQILEEVHGGVLIKEGNETNFTMEEARKAIEEGREIVESMKENELPVQFVEDQLFEAERVFEQATLASILRGDVEAKETEKREAREALRLIDWEEIHYGDVLHFTNLIRQREQESYLVLDSLSVVQHSFEEFREENDGGEILLSPGFSDSVSLAEQAQQAFEEDRQDEAIELLNEARDQLERQREESARLTSLRRGALNFFQRNWPLLLAGLAIAGVIGFFLHGRISEGLLLRKIKKMHAEKKALVSLMKKAQVERFKENKIPALVYDIRMKKYKDRMDEINSDLPIFEKRLDRKQGLKR